MSHWLFAYPTFVDGLIGALVSTIRGEPNSIAVVVGSTVNRVNAEDQCVAHLVVGRQPSFGPQAAQQLLRAGPQAPSRSPDLCPGSRMGFVDATRIDIGLPV